MKSKKLSNSLMSRKPLLTEEEKRSLTDDQQTDLLLKRLKAKTTPVDNTAWAEKFEEKRNI